MSEGMSKEKLLNTSITLFAKGKEIYFGPISDFGIKLKVTLNILWASLKFDNCAPQQTRVSICIPIAIFY